MDAAYFSARADRMHDINLHRFWPPPGAETRKGPGRDARASFEKNNRNNQPNNLNRPAMPEKSVRPES
jgi:hypothetical protein